jgi:hypothetical protein
MVAESNTRVGIGGGAVHCQVCDGLPHWSFKDGKPNLVSGSLFDVWHLLSHGMSNQDIANKLNFSSPYVKAKVTEIFNAVGLTIGLGKSGLQRIKSILLFWGIAVYEEGQV